MADFNKSNMWTLLGGVEDQPVEVNSHRPKAPKKLKKPKVHDPFSPFITFFAGILTDMLKEGRFDPELVNLFIEIQDRCCFAPRSSTDFDDEADVFRQIMAAIGRLHKVRERGITSEMWYTFKQYVNRNGVCRAYCKAAKEAKLKAEADKEIETACAHQSMEVFPALSPPAKSA